MITFLFTIKNRKIEPNFLQSFTSFMDDVEVVFACREGAKLDILPASGVRARINHFPASATEEDMIESEVKKMELGTFVLVRDGAGEFDINKAKNMIIAEKSGKDVVLLKRREEKNKVKAFFSGLIKKFVSLVFNFRFYEGEIGMQVFSPKALNLLKINGTANLTKLNRWIGLNVFTIEADVPKTIVECREKKLVTISATSFWIAFVFAFAGSIVLGTLVKVPWLGVLGLIVVNLFTFTSALYNLLRLYSVLTIGDLYAKKLGIIKTEEVKSE